MEWETEMVRRLSKAVNGEKDQIMAEYSRLTGKSVATLYRIAKKNGWDSGRKKRADAGELRSGITDEALQFCSALMQESARQVKGVIMPVSKVMKIAVDNGVLAEGQISEPRLQALLAEREMNAAALDGVDPSIRMASLHPNHVHVFDASICIQYYLKGKKELKLIDARDYNKKKPANLDKIKNRLIRLVLVDHFSHFIFVKYYLAAGENQQITFDFLTAAWRGGHHELLPMRGVPFYVLMDAGSANIAKGIVALLKRLEIEFPENMPHNPKRQGSAEVAQNIVERHFESGLALEPATTMEELNAWALDWSVWWNATRTMRRHGMTRSACWMTIKQEQLRDLPSDEILQDLYAEPEVDRTVRQDNTITFRSVDYRLKHIPGIRPGKKVRVVLRPYHWPQVAVMFEETEYLVNPIGTLAGGFSADSAVIGVEYKAQPDSPVEKVRKANENFVYGEERKKGDLPFGGTLRVHGHHAEKLAGITMLPRRGTPIEVDRPAGPAQIPMGEHLKRLLNKTGKVSPELNREMRSHFGTSISLQDSDAVIAAILDDRDWRPAVAVAL